MLRQSIGDQKRKSGEPYIIHPIQVAYILAGLELDTDTICAALLHDVVEDTETTHEDLIREFGEPVAEMVDGVTKLGKLQYTTKEGTGIGTEPVPEATSAPVFWERRGQACGERRTG